MPTGYEADNHRAMQRIAGALERLADLAELQYLENVDLDEARIDGTRIPSKIAARALALRRRLWPDIAK